MVYVILRAQNDYAAGCFKQYGLPTDSTGQYAAMFKPFHLIGMELSVSVLSAALRGEATGSTREWRGDAVAVAKRALAKGEMLDGEGGHTVWGKACPARDSAAGALLPIGLAHRVRLRRDIARGTVLRMADVDLDETQTGVRLRREMLAGAAAGR